MYLLQRLLLDQELDKCLVLFGFGSTFGTILPIHMYINTCVPKVYKYAALPNECWTTSVVPFRFFFLNVVGWSLLL